MEREQPEQMYAVVATGGFETAMANLESRISIPKDVVFREIAGEAVILNLQTGRYFGLDEVGTRMWQLLAQHHQVEPALDDLAQEYDATKEQLQHDLLELVDKLVSHQLVEIDGT